MRKTLSIILVVSSGTLALTATAVVERASPSRTGLEREAPSTPGRTEAEAPRPTADPGCGAPPEQVEPEPRTAAPRRSGDLFTVDLSAPLVCQP